MTVLNMNNPRPKLNLYIATSPYNMFLSCGIAFSKETESHMLLVIKDFCDADKQIKSIQAWGNSPFDEIIAIPGYYSLPGLFKTSLLHRKNIRHLKHLILNYQCPDIYIFNDNKVLAQFILQYTKKQRPDAKCYYVDEGTFAYDSTVFNPKNKLRNLLENIVLGFHFHDIRVLGTSPWIDETLALYPEYIRPELRQRPVSALPRDNLKNIYRKGFLIDYLKTLNINPDFPSADLFIPLERSHFVAKYPAYRTFIREVITAGLNKNLEVTIKYHPRENADDYLNLRTIKGVTVLPRQVPIELFYSKAENHLKVIVGAATTSLLTAQWMLQDVKIISFARIIGNSDPRIIKMFEKLGIKIPVSQEDFFNLLMIK